MTVIVPAHNYAQYLPEAIRSMTAQTWQDWECIVVDDGSTDESPQVLERLSAEDPRIIHLSQAHRRVSAARNLGLRRARGEFIQFLDADDLLPPAKLEIHLRALRADRDADIVYGPSAYFDDGAPEVLMEGPPQGRAPLGSGVDGPGLVMLTHLLAANPHDDRGCAGPEGRAGTSGWVR